MKVLIGDIFESPCSAIVNTVNCVGVMGKGIAREFKKAYPSMYADYVEKCNSGQVITGVPYVYVNYNGKKILNFPTKKHWRSPSKVSYILEGLDWFVNNYSKYQIDSIAFPPLGCGNGGLTWDIVGPLMYQKLQPLPIDIEIYAPFGTAKSQIASEYLSRDTDLKDIEGKMQNRLNPKWYLILEAVRELNNRTYSLNVGRTIYQKICYVITRYGLKTGFTFTKGTYGPYSSEAKDSITAFANANLLTETTLGKMQLMKVSDNLCIHEKEYSQSEWTAMKNTVDLFARIKSTEQAEIVATVLYSFDELAKKTQQISDKDVFDYVMEWKPRWSKEKEYEVSDAIHNLAILSLITVTHSNRLIDTVLF